MENNQCIWELRRKNIQLQIINSISQSITVDMTFEEVMRNITEKLQTVISYDILNFCLLNEHDELVIKNCIPKDINFFVEGEVLKPENSVAWRSIIDRKAMIKEDITADKLKYREYLYLSRLNIRSIMIVPLLVKNNAMGTINLGSKSKAYYELEDVAFLQEVADQLAVIIESSRLYIAEKHLKLEWQKSFKTAQRLMNEMLKRNTQLEILNNIARTITLDTSFYEMMGKVAIKLNEIIPFDFLGLCLLEDEGLVLKKTIPKRNDFLLEGTILDIVNSAPSQVIMQKKMLIRTDIRNDRQNFTEDKMLNKLNINSAVIVPLIIKDKVLGTFNLESRNIFTYLDEDCLFLQQVADLLAIHLENGRLYRNIKLKEITAPTIGECEDGFYIGKNKAMRDIVNIVKKIAPQNVCVLIAGETGTGKEVLAKFIHREYKGGAAPFLAVNCGAFTETLLESELFGHEKGAFTGALTARKGIFEMANGGTLFLDEIGEASLSTQVKLLRVLENPQEIYRIGGQKPYCSDVRIIAATNLNLENAIQAGEFRKDLYYRLKGIKLKLPPLREKKEDIPNLIEFLLKNRFHNSKINIVPKVMQKLANYSWPGNIRELINVLQQIILLENGLEINTLQFIELDDHSTKNNEQLEAIFPYGMNFDFNIEDIKQGFNLLQLLTNIKKAQIKGVKELIGKVLQHTKGDRDQAAKLLNISRRQLQYYLIEK